MTLFATFPSASTTNTYSYTGLNGYAYKFEIRPRDNAGNTGATWTTSTDIARIDTTPPVLGNLIDTTSANLLATTSQAFAFTYNDGGAPVQLTANFEDFSNASNWLPIPSPFAYSFSSNQNISLVDGGDRSADGGSARQYTYRTTRICDQAGNCWNGTQDFNYNVYSNPNYAPMNTQDLLALVGAVADGQGRDFVHIIKDGYGNAIIPALGINRSVSMNLTGITNTMFLDQYTRT